MEKVVKIGKLKTFNLDADEDKTHDNYMALLIAIVIDEDDKDYKSLVYNRNLFDKNEEIKRLQEIEEIRARGEQTELEKWYKGINKASTKQKRANSLLSKLAKKRHEEYKKSKEEIFSKYLDNTVDTNTIDTDDIIEYKIKVVNIQTDEVKIYTTRKELSKDIGVEQKTIITYIKNKIIYDKKYIFLVYNEKLTKEELSVYKKPRKKIKATNIVTNEVKIFNKFREASDFFNVNYITFQQRYTKGMRNIGDWILEDGRKGEGE